MRPCCVKAPSILSQALWVQCRYASSRPRKAPSLRSGKRKLDPRLGSIPIPEPPLQMFMTDVKTGSLDLKWMEAVRIARKCISAAQKYLTTSNLDTSDIDPDVQKIALVASMLSRSPPHRVVSDCILTELAQKGDPWSIVFLGSQMNTSISWLPQKIEALARTYQNWPAMLLHGINLERKGQLQDAAYWCRKAMEITNDLEPEQETIYHGLFQLPFPNEVYGRISIKLSENEEALKAAQKSANLYDSLRSYMIILRTMQEDSFDWEKTEEHLTKCAASGDAQACYELGALYYLRSLEPEWIQQNDFPSVLPKKILEKLVAQPSRFVFPEDYRRLAKEWLDLSANLGNNFAAWRMAILLREENKLEESLSYLKDGESDPPSNERICRIHSERVNSAFKS